MPEPSAVDTQRVHRGQLVNDDGDTLGPLGTVLQPLLAESGGGFTLGAEVRREVALATAITNGTEITPADPTKACYVMAEFSNDTGSTQNAAIESWFNSQRDSVYVPDEGSTSARMLLGVGETYYVSSLNGCTVSRLIEKSIS